MFQGMNVWYKTKKCHPHPGLKLCAPDGRGWQWGSPLFQSHLAAAAEVRWVLFHSREKLSVLMESAQFR